MPEVYNPFPDIDSVKINNNPTIISPNAAYGISFYSTRESLADVNDYRSFLKCVESKVRKSETYSNYKSFVMNNLGIDHCQIHGYINGEMATLEMHHAVLTLFDIALMITEYLLNTTGYATTFRVAQIIKDEHRAGNIATVILSKTPHQVLHDNTEFFIHPRMCLGNWPLLIEKYQQGLTQDVTVKLLYYLKKAINTEDTDDQGLLNLSEKIKDWSERYYG